MSDIVIKMKDTLKDMLVDVIERIAYEVDLFIVLLQLVFPVCLSMMDISIVSMMLLSGILLFVASYVRNLSYNMNSELTDGMPIPEHRLTSVDNGIISLEDKEQALVYLCRLEDYLERKEYL